MRWLEANFGVLQFYYLFLMFLEWANALVPPTPFQGWRKKGFKVFNGLEGLEGFKGLRAGKRQAWTRLSGP